MSEFLQRNRGALLATALGLLAASTFYFSTNPIHKHFDYTNRVALSLLEGHIGLTEQAPSWLNEFVPVGGRWYSVFPLGAVLANLPVALLQKIGVVDEWPARGLAAVLAGLSVFFFYRLSAVRDDLTEPRRALLAVFPVFATWAWCNLGFGGAWQIALGFAILGQTAALYYTLVRRNPLAAGAWFALAFGNRTELLLTAPIFLALLLPRPLCELRQNWRASLQPAIRFNAVPAALLLCTAIYNWMRFGSVADFGYEHIPGVLSEPWYQQGLFSLSAIRWNAYEMLFRGMIEIPQFPYLRPHAFGCSIFLASPFLFLLFRDRARHSTACWCAIGLLTLLLWAHGNAGGWQFSYRYGMILIPWMFVVIVENGGRAISRNEGVLFAITVTINALAMYEFLWTQLIQP
jgi:hypothetical protein